MNVQTSKAAILPFLLVIFCVFCGLQFLFLSSSCTPQRTVPFKKPEADSVLVNHVPHLPKWKSLGPFKMTSGSGLGTNIGRITHIAVHPNSENIIYAGARGCGLWKTTDGGQNWNAIADNLPSITVEGIALAPSRPSRVYLVTPKGVFRSDNAGGSWIQVHDKNLNARTLDGGNIFVHPTRHDEIYLTAIRRGDANNSGILKSTDGGQNWSRVLVGFATGLHMDLNDPDVLYAALSDMPSGGTGLYVSHNGGAQWRKMNGCAGGRLPVAGEKVSVKFSLSKSRIYASYIYRAASPVRWELYRTTDISCSVGGIPEHTWEKAWSPNEGTSKTLWSGLYADPSNSKFVYATGTQFWVSDNSGSSFKKITPQPHVDNHGFAFHPKDPKILFVGNDGGIFRSSNHAQKNSWSFIGEGISNVEFFDIADAPTNPKLLIGGTQDNGTARWDGSGTTWKFLWGGDSEYGEIDPKDSKIMYENGQGIRQLTMRKSGSTKKIHEDIPDDGRYVWAGEYQAAPLNQFMIHPRRPEILFATAGNLYLSVTPNYPSPPSSWKGGFTKVFTPIDSGEDCVRIAIDPSVSLALTSSAFSPRTVKTSLVYVGSSRGRVYAGPFNNSWNEIFQHPSSQKIADIEVDPLNPNTFYAAFFADSGSRIYRIKRSGSAPFQFQATDITANFPNNIKPYAIGVDLLNPNRIYVGCSEGIFRGISNAAGSNWTWSAYANGIPAAAQVIDLEVHPATGIMRAGTFGRGAYEINTSAETVGSVLAVEGKVKLLRVHDLGTGYGPPLDQIKGEVVVQLDTAPGKSFGFTLREDNNEAAHANMLYLLRTAFKTGRKVKIDYRRTGIRNGVIIRTNLL